MGKFGPIVLLAVVQLVLVLAAPSTAPTAANTALGADPYATTQSGVPGAGTTTLPPGATPAQVAAAGGGGTVAGGGTSTAGGGTTAGGSTAGGPTAPASRDTSHRVSGRQFDPPPDYHPPPGVPGGPRAPFPDNRAPT